MYSEWKASEAPGSLLWVHGKRALMPIPFCLFQRLKFSVFVAGAGKSVLWYVKIFIFLSGELIMLAALQSSGTSMS
jgi:hypothetical protein